MFRVRSVADPIKQMKMACYCYDASSLPQHTNPDFSFLNKFFYLFFFFKHKEKLIIAIDKPTLVVDITISMVKGELK